MLDKEGKWNHLLVTYQFIFSMSKLNLFSMHFKMFMFYDVKSSRLHSVLIHIELRENELIVHCGGT